MKKKNASFLGGLYMYDTIVAISTSLGIGAISIIRLSGSEAINIVNEIFKGKNLTNVRASGSDEAIKLTPPLELNLEIGLGIMNEDEYLEVTPKSIRLRKKFLTENERVKSKRNK